MSVDAEQQVLDDHAVLVGCDILRSLPAVRKRTGVAARPGVPVEEHSGEAGHLLTVAEATGSERRLHPIGDTGIHRREESTGIVGVERSAAKLLNRVFEHPGKLAAGKTRPSRLAEPATPPQHAPQPLPRPVDQALARRLGIIVCGRSDDARNSPIGRPTRSGCSMATPRDAAGTTASRPEESAS